jgi:single-strand DNA-binding protein
MSRSVNSVTLLGNVGQPPETRTTQGGTKVTTVSLATNERRKSGESWVDHVEWHSITLFGRLAEIAEQYLRKGSKVFVTGRLRTTSWEDDHQVKRWRTNIVAEELVLLDAADNRQPNPPDEAYGEAF